MAEIITTLHPENDPNTNLYPNIKKENIPNKSISTDKLDDNVLSLIGSLKPSGTDTSTNILAFTSNKGIYVATDNGHWYYWNGTAYADGGIYQSSEDIEQIKKDIDNLETEFTNEFNSCFDITEHNPINLLDTSTVTWGKYCTDKGIIADNSSYWYTDYIPVKVGKTYTRQRGELTVVQGRTIVPTRWISCYDANKNILSNLGSSDNPTSFTVPDGVSFIRLSGSTYMESINNPTIVEGTEVLDYTPYFTPYTSKILKAECNNDIYINTLIELKNRTNGLRYYFDINSNNFISEEEPQDINNYSIEFKGIINTFNGLIIGHGYNVNGGGYVKVTPTNFEYYLGTETTPRKSVTHDLTIKDYISIKIDTSLKDVVATFTITTNGGTYTYTGTWDVRLGVLGVYSVGTNDLTDCVLSYFARGWNKDIHIYGDSYVGPYIGRWTYYLIHNDYTNYNLNAYSGRNSQTALNSAKMVLKHSIPKKIIWCLGMNDGDTNGMVNASWKSCVEELMEICQNKGIELILATIPNVPTIDNTAKNAYVRASGYRYIDFATSVGASSDSTWFDGMLYSDGVHPEIPGAIALYNQAIADVPELMD